MTFQCPNDNNWYRLTSYLVQFQLMISIYIEMLCNTNQIWIGQNYLVIPGSSQFPECKTANLRHWRTGSKDMWIGEIEIGSSMMWCCKSQVNGLNSAVERLWNGILTNGSSHDYKIYSPCHLCKIQEILNLLINMGDLHIQWNILNMPKDCQYVYN